MERFVPLDQLLKQVSTKNFRRWIDKVTFKKIMFVWLGLIFIFGLIYHVLSNDSAYLFYNVKGIRVASPTDAIYFSFVSATTAGFGDIVPFGYFKTISVLELISGLLILALVTSKLVSIKQDAILSELYDLSFNEKINRLRHSLLLFRQNLGRAISRTSESALGKREVTELFTYISSLEDILNEVSLLIQKPEEGSFIQAMDAINTELVFNSISNSFEKLGELLRFLNANRVEWARELTLGVISRCLALLENLFEKLNSTEGLTEMKLLDLNVRKKGVVQSLNVEMEKAQQWQKGVKFTSLNKSA